MLTDMQLTMRSARYQNTGVASPKVTWPWFRPLNAKSECLKIRNLHGLEGQAFCLQWTVGVWNWSVYMYAPC